MKPKVDTCLAPDAPSVAPRVEPRDADTIIARAAGEAS
jgi:hypothetical protein